MSKPTTLAAIIATGEAVSGPCVIEAFHLAAGSDAATAVIRDGDDGGPYVAKLSAVATGNDYLPGSFRFTEYCHVTLTGTAPVLTIALDNPRINQLNPS